MTNVPVRQISSSFPSITKTRVRYVVQDGVKTQVVDSQNDKVIREIPRELSSNVYLSIIA